MANNKLWFQWTVVFSVKKNWVEDGFDLTNDRARDMIENDLRYAHSNEVAARVIRRPRSHVIAKVQGYSNKQIRAGEHKPRG